MHCDPQYMPSIVVGKYPGGHAEHLKMVNEEPILWGTVYECSNYREQTHPLITDDDWLRPKYMPQCANRDRSGVRDCNLCCRCLNGLPATFQEKSWEEYRDAAIRI
jgi:hypothetical protein